MSKEHRFDENELIGSLREALAHAQGKLPLRTTLTRPSAEKLIMTLSREKAKYRLLLQNNPDQTPPVLPSKNLTVAGLHRYKAALRAYDAARLDLKLASPAQIQKENSGVGAASQRRRILRFSRHSTRSDAKRNAPQIPTPL